MGTRSGRARRGILAAIATTSAALLGSASSPAAASLVIDVRTLPIGGKLAFVGAGATITMGVFARVSGTNATQQVGEFGGGNGDDVRNDERVNIVTGSFQSVGPLLGNLTLGAAGGQVTPNPRIAPFGASGSTNGIAQDWDSDGDLDIGTIGTDPATMFVARAASGSAATRFNSTSTPTKGWSDDGGNFNGNSNDTIIDPAQAEIQIGTLRFVVTAGVPGFTAVNFVPRPTTDAGSALWFEDGVATGRTPGTGTYLLGMPVNIIWEPEPSTFGMISVTGVGLLARRRRDD